MHTYVYVMSQVLYRVLDDYDKETNIFSMIHKTSSNLKKKKKGYKKKIIVMTSMSNLLLRAIEN